MADEKDCAGNLGGEQVCTETHEFGVAELDGHTKLIERDLGIEDICSTT